jgi:superfamily II DNA/RNA helicase
VSPQALVLAPTRELAQQIEKVMRALGDYLQVRVCVGNGEMRADLRSNFEPQYCKPSASDDQATGQMP